MIDEERYTVLLICDAIERDANFFSFLINQETATTANVERINLITKLREELLEGNEFLSDDVTKFIYDNANMLKNSLDTYYKEYADLFADVEEEEITNEEETKKVEINADDALGIQGEQPIFVDIQTANVQNDLTTSRPDVPNREVSNPEPVVNQAPVVEPVQMQQSQPDAPKIVQPTVQNSPSLSIALALDNLKKELEATKREIDFLQNLCYNSSVPAKKKHFEDLAMYEAYYKQIEELIERTKQCQTFSDDTIKNDKRYQELIERIAEVTSSLGEKQSKIVKTIKENRIKNLKNKQGRVQEKQRKIVDGNILELNKKQMRQAAKQSRVEGLNRYYDDQIARLTEEKNAIIDNVEFGENAVINDIKEKYYQLKIKPYIKKIEKLKKLKEKSGQLHGFRKLNANFKSARQELIDQLKGFRDSLISAAEEEFEPLAMDEEMESGKIL